MPFPLITRAVRAEGAPLAAGAIAVWLAWGWSAGGFSASSFGLLGAMLVAALAAALAALPVRPVGTLRAVALGALAALAAWSFASAAWADFPGEAWTGSLKTLLYLASFAAFVLWGWDGDGRVAVLAAFSLGVAVLGVATLLEAVTSASPERLFTDGRLDGPVEYMNASVALWMLGLWPAAFLASARSLPVALRAVAGASATLLLGLAVLGQSRGWLYLLAPAAVLFLLLARQRLRAAAGLALAALACAPAVPWLLDVADAVAAGGGAAAIDEAALALAVAAAAAGGLVALWAAADRRIVLSARAHRAAGVVALGAAVVALAAGGAIGAASLDDPRAWASDRWDDFTGGPFPEGSDRLGGSLGTNRYAEWTVAWHVFTAHPLAGIGADNYLAEYLRERDDDTYHPRYPHSTPLRLLSQLGVVGAGLFAVFLAAALTLALRARRSLDAVGGGATGAALASFGYWLLHGSIDWFWELPALAAPAFGLLGLAAAPPARAAAAERLPAAGRAAVAVAAVAAAAVLGLAWASDAYEDAAIAGWRTDPERSYSLLERAARLAPLSGEPHAVLGAVALRMDDRARAREAFEEARRREPENWYVNLQLALLAAARGDFATAGARIADARSQNPREPAVRLADRLVAQRRRLDPETVNGLLRRRIEETVEAQTARGAFTTGPD